MISIRSLLTRFGGFGASVVVSSLVSLLAIPVIVVVLGGGTWAHLAVASSIGAFFAVLVAFGWGVSGPAMIARTPLALRQRTFRESLAVRLVLLFVLGPIAALCIAPVVGGDVFASIAYGIIPMVAALGATWFFVGQAQPWRLLLFDTLPRSLGVVAGCIGLLTGASLDAFVFIQGAGVIVAVIASAAVVLRRQPGTAQSEQFRPFSVLRSQLAGVVTASTAALYVNAPLIVVSVVAPVAAPAYAVADKVLKFAVAAIAPVSQVAQGWVGDTDDSVVARRARRAARLVIFLGGAVGVIFAALLPLVVHILAGASLSVGFDIAVPLGVAFACIVASQVVGLASLMSLDRAVAVAVSTVLGAGLGVPLMIIAGSAFQSVGVAWAVAVSEAAVLAYQLVDLRRTLAVPVRFMGSESI